jgi:hypothetical protein
MTGNLDLVLARDDAGELRLWACRGEGKGCERNRYRKSKKQCVDCYGPLPENMTLGEVQKKLERGDA